MTFVFCMDYIEKNGKFIPQELFPFVFSSPKSIKFEMSALLLFRKHIVFSTLPGIKKLPIFTLDTLTWESRSENIDVFQVYRYIIIVPISS